MATLRLAKKTATGGRLRPLLLEAPTEEIKKRRITELKDLTAMIRLDLGESPTQQKRPIRTVDVSKYFLSEILSDCKVVAGEKEFPAHRFVLTEISEFCEKMFSIDMTENKNRVWKIDDFEPEVVKEFLEYAYKGTSEQIKFAKDTFILQELFRMSHKYDFVPLWDQCVILLTGMINTKNVVSMYHLGYGYGSRTLKVAAKNYFISYKLHVIPNLDAIRQLQEIYPDDMVYDLVIK